MKILFVDDNQLNQKLFERFFNRVYSGHKIDLASNGLEAVEKVKNAAYDIIVMDWEMPLLGGLEATEQIRAFEKEENKVPVKILAYSSIATDDENALEKLGFNGFLPKKLSTQSIQAVFLKHFPNIQEH